MESTLEEKKKVSSRRAILYQEPQTIAQTMAAGGWGYMSNVQGQQYCLVTDQIAFMLFWPLLVLFIAGSWVAKGVCYILWLIFAGGIAKLWGLG